MTATVRQPSWWHSALHLSITRRVDMPYAMTDDIRAILRDHGRLAVDVAALGDESNLYEAGLNSHASVNLMLALEERFDIEFPDRMLRRGAFASITAIRAGLEELIGAGA
jgi:acyl carrier protein